MSKLLGAACSCWFSDRAPCLVQIVVAITEGGAVCGGYNPAGWIGLGDDRDSIAAFLFTWPDGDTSKDPAKLEKACGQCFTAVDGAVEP